MLRQSNSPVTIVKPAKNTKINANFDGSICYVSVSNGELSLYINCSANVLNLGSNVSVQRLVSDWTPAVRTIIELIGGRDNNLVGGRANCQIRMETSHIIVAICLRHHWSLRINIWFLPLILSIGYTNEIESVARYHSD